MTILPPYLPSPSANAQRLAMRDRPLRGRLARLREVPGTLRKVIALRAYVGKPNRKMCSLYLSLMDRFGVKLDEFGDAKTRLENL